MKIDKLIFCANNHSFLLDSISNIKSIPLPPGFEFDVNVDYKSESKAEKDLNKGSNSISNENSNSISQNKSKETIILEISSNIENFINVNFFNI